MPRSLEEKDTSPNEFVDMGEHGGVEREVPRGFWPSMRDMLLLCLHCPILIIQMWVIESLIKILVGLKQIVLVI